MSKDLFMMLREEEVATSNFLPTKNEIKKSSLDFARNLIDSGEHNIKEVYAQSLRLKEALTTIENELKTAIGNENFEAFGLKGSFRSGGSTLNYDEDPVYCQLKKDLDDRVELLKLAQKQEVLDLYGNEVPKVSLKHRKSSMSITF